MWNYNELPARELARFLDRSPSRYHVIHNLAEMLNGFTRLSEGECWQLESGHGYYVVRNDSSIIAFVTPEEKLGSLKITAAHSDSPCFKVKANGEMNSPENYIRLNTEKYGGMIMSGWLDRPLSLAGRVVIKNDNTFESHLFNVDRDLLMIPSVAIHMNRDINDGYKFNPQVDMIPTIGLKNKDEESTGLMDIIAEASGVKAEDILGSDIYLYNRQEATIWGMNNEFISAGCLDDLECAWSCMFALAHSSGRVSKDTLKMCCVFDNEEVGSLTAQGADSTFLTDTLKRVCKAMEYDEADLMQAAANGFMVSADNAHAVHPNHSEFTDPTNRPVINGGIVIKFNANQKYTTDARSEAMFRDICKQAEVPVQTYANRSDMPGGSTLGNLANRHLSISTVDIGLPQLAMHSVYETAGVKDIEYMVGAMEEFYK